MKLSCRYNADLANEHNIGAFMEIEKWLSSKIITLSCLNRQATRKLGHCESFFFVWNTCEQDTEVWPLYGITS